MIDLYLMSPPPRGWALRARSNFRSREAAPVDAAQARREWLALARAIEANGGVVAALPPPSDAFTGMTYAAECGQIVTPPGKTPRFILPRMISPHRQPERDHWGPFAKTLGFDVVDPVGPGEGIWEAQGDVAHFDGATLLFYGGRTDERGMDAASKFFDGGAELLRLRIREPAFHGNMAALPLPKIDRMLVCPAVIELDSLAKLRRRFGDRLFEVTEAEIRSYATNGLPMGEVLLAPSIVPERVKALVEKAGLRVVPMKMGELCEKGGGASRCLVSYARVPKSAVRIPDANRLPAIAAEIEAESRA